MEDPRWHCRISKVIRKDGRGQFRVLRNDGRDRSAEQLLKTFHEYARELAEKFPNDAAGFAIVMWGRDGRWSRGRSATPSSPIPFTLVPALAAEVLRRDTMSEVTSGLLYGEDDKA